MGFKTILKNITNDLSRRHYASTFVALRRRFLRFGEVRP
jgi:hypothetical protein